MLGAIIGDIIGSRFEFNPTNQYNFQLFTPECSFTDDTICTIAVADAIVRGIDYGTSIHYWCRKYPNPMGGYGGNFRKWVLSDDPQPYGSFGNGSAMRVSPIGWWYDDPEDVLAQALKSAECTHNHPQGIIGAMAVATAVRDCRILRMRSNGQEVSRDDVLRHGLAGAIRYYCDDPENFSLDIEDYRNCFDETCRGTVPPALWIVLNSNNYEDAVRRAVCLGADADTIGAIVGSIAEARWGIPEWLKRRVVSYLPEDMLAVINRFNSHLNRLRRLTRKCRYYHAEDFQPVEAQHRQAYDIEKSWANDLARSYRYADSIKAWMYKYQPKEQWQALADEYDLPKSLLGYIARRILKPVDKGMEPLRHFLDEHYISRGKQSAQSADGQSQADAQTEHTKLMMLWKLALGDLNKLLTGEDPLPPKTKIATADMFNIQPLSPKDDLSHVNLSVTIPEDAMNILRRGHIPQVMEDHWAMYCDDTHLRYIRSWTGMIAFEARYHKRGDTYIIDDLTINRALCEFGVNGDEAGVALFHYLLTAETGADSSQAWDAYIQAWDTLNKKYAKH